MNGEIMIQIVIYFRCKFYDLDKFMNYRTISVDNSGYIGFKIIEQNLKKYLIYLSVQEKLYTYYQIALHHPSHD